MKERRNLLIPIIITAVTAACGELPEEGLPIQMQENPVPLRLSISTPGQISKSMITGNSLPDGAEIGLTLTDSEGRIYDGLPYSNIRFTADGYSMQQKWTPETDVMLSSSDASVHAYYPYSDQVTDITSIPVKATSSYQDDVMYSESLTGLNNRKPEASVTMKHALSAIRLSIRRGTYSGPGHLTSISVKGDNIATEGILDATDGKLSSLRGFGAPVSLSFNTTLQESTATEHDIIIIPGERQASASIELTIDNETYSICTDAIKFEQGKVAVYEAVVNNSAVKISSVKVGIWKYDSAGNPVIEKERSITISGDTEGISFANSIESDGRVKIVAVPVNEYTEVNPVSLSGEAVIEDSLDPQRGSRTIFLSDIQSDITLQFNGLGYWITTTYEITDASAEVRLIYNGTCARMKIDGNEITPTQKYTFQSTGTHTVQYMFASNTTIPGYKLRNDHITSIIIPEGVKTLESYGINSCPALTSISLPESLTSCGYDGLSYNRSLKTLVLPADLNLGNNALRECTSLESVELPSAARSIPSSLLSGCTALKEIKIPDQVTAIGSNAFERTGITSIVLPEGVTEIPSGMCEACKSLERITLSSATTSIGQMAFNNCTNLYEISYTDGEKHSGCLYMKEGIRSVGIRAFCNCDRLSSLHIPSTLTSFEYGAFSTRAMAAVSIDSSNPVFETREGFNGIIEKYTDVLRFGCIGTAVIPASVKSIGDYAYYCVPVSSIDLHSGITHVGTNAFYCPSSALGLIICRSLTPPSLGNEVFNLKRNGTLKVKAEVLETYRQSAWMSKTAYLPGYFNWSIGALGENE